MNSFGRHLRIQLFGESHGPGVGVVVDGVPPGLPLSLHALRQDLAARRPGSSLLVSQRNEPDEPEILSGWHEGFTTGTPLAILIRNHDADSRPYEATSQTPRPGHADYPSHVASFGFHDPRGGGHNSGRLTASLVAAGTIAELVLKQHKIRGAAHLHQVEEVRGPDRAHPVTTILKRAAKSPLRTAHGELEEEFSRRILAARKEQDSVGGVIEFVADGLPAGLGDPFFDSVESVLSHLLFALPGVKAVSFGSGFDAAIMRGSAHNDAFHVTNGAVTTMTNHAGGILGGRTVGTEVWGHVAMKPASTLPGRKQDTVDLATMAGATIKPTGRHDPCIAVRAVPVVQACLRLVLADFVLQARRDGLVAVPEARHSGRHAAASRAPGAKTGPGRTASQE